MSGKSCLFLIISILYSSNVFASSCEEYLNDAEMISGIVPKFDNNGKVRAFVMYGTATFIVPKTSLINNARRKAELAAKRSYSEFLKTNTNSETIVQNIVDQVEQTDGDGNTAALVTELSTTVDTMVESSSAVLSGLIKLDECVDIDNKEIFVQLGWKPELSQAASSARDSMLNATDNKLSKKNKMELNQKIKEGKGYRKKSSLADEF